MRCAICGDKFREEMQEVAPGQLEVVVTEEVMAFSDPDSGKTVYRHKGCKWTGDKNELVKEKHRLQRERKERSE